ncbi:hypothetical protein PINS_up009340 [Pythium insidiosum]|nr:hypothetical protein PINS_up009340 [Pythium insidiosum]
MEIVKMPGQVLLPVVSLASVGSSAPVAFEDVLIVIPSAPLGMSIRSETRSPNGSAMLIQARETTNTMIRDAFRHGVLRDGDEIIAINDISLRNRPVVWLRDLLGVLPPPFRVWIRTSARRTLPPTLLPPPAAAPAPSSQQQTPQPTPTKLGTSKPPTPAPAPSPKATHPSSQPSTTTSSVMTQPSKDAPTKASSAPSTRSPMDEALSTDWPWFYLRSDGKLAMSLTWKSLDAGFFVAKWNPATWSRLFGNVESLLGFRLRREHPEFHETRALTEMPRRETAVPSYLLEHRASLKHKRARGPNASVFVGVNVELATRSDEEWDAMPRLEVGTTVDVAKRTWPGINKLGGAGRIKKVHEVTSADGKRTQFLYDVAYILGGSEKKIERRWITVVKMDGEDKSGGNNATTESSSSSSTAPMAAAAGDASVESASPTDEDDDADNKPQRLRLGLRLGRRPEHKDTELPPATADAATTMTTVDSNRRRRVQLQFTVHSKSVHLERLALGDGEQQSASASKVLLWHQHFPAKQSAHDAALSDALCGELLYTEPRGEHAEGDADAVDSDDEENDIKTQLRDAQQAFERVMARNQELLAALQLRVSREYRTKAYRTQELEQIQARHYEQLYREMAAARKRFDESDEEDEDDDDDDDQEEEAGAASAQVPAVSTASKTTRRRRRKRRDSSDSSSSSHNEDEDESCGGLFVNRIKQEGDEVCALCELTGGDFAATACGRVVHPQCAMYTPETFFKDGVAHGPRADSRSRAARAELRDLRWQARAQQDPVREPALLVAYHVACAFVNGLLTRDPYYQAWCPKHLKTSGMAAEVEWPRHLRPQDGSRPETVDGHDDEVDSADDEHDGRRLSGRPRLASRQALAARTQ